MHWNYLRGLGKHRLVDHNPDSGSMGLGGICVSNKLPGGADSAGPSSTLGGPLNYTASLGGVDGDRSLPTLGGRPGVILPLPVHLLADRH